jgi:hypothetical protein
MAALPRRTLEPFTNYIRLRDPAPARFPLNVRHEGLRQSYRESLHEASVLHLWQICKTRHLKVRTTGLLAWADKDVPSVRSFHSG